MMILAPFAAASMNAERFRFSSSMDTVRMVELYHRLGR
jgi:hypothetical protein